MEVSSQISFLCCPKPAHPWAMAYSYQEFLNVKLSADCFKSLVEDEDFIR